MCFFSDVSQMHLHDPSGFPIMQKKKKKRSKVMVCFRTTQTILLTRTNPISCHQVGGDQLPAKVQHQNAVITGQVTNTTILRQPVAFWAETGFCILSFPATKKNILFIQHREIWWSHVLRNNWLWTLGSTTFQERLEHWAVTEVIVFRPQRSQQKSVFLFQEA